jgi:hypothetical protein
MCIGIHRSSLPSWVRSNGSTQLDSPLLRSRSARSFGSSSPLRDGSTLYSLQSIKKKDLLLSTDSGLVLDTLHDCFIFVSLASCWLPSCHRDWMSWSVSTYDASTYTYGLTSLFSLAAGVRMLAVVYVYLYTCNLLINYVIEIFLTFIRSSFDSAVYDPHNYYQREFLNSLTSNGLLPTHVPSLKINCSTVSCYFGISIYLMDDAMQHELSLELNWLFYFILCYKHEQS